MEVVLIEGNENTGKTTLCKIIEERLIDAGYVNVCRERRPECKYAYEQDFTAIYRKDHCIIIINSESESGGIKRFKKMYTENSLEYTVLITAIRTPKSPKPPKPPYDLHNRMKKIYGSDGAISFNEHKIELITISKVDCSSILGELQKRVSAVLDKIKINLQCEVELTVCKKQNHLEKKQ